MEVVKLQEAAAAEKQQFSAFNNAQFGASIFKNADGSKRQNRRAAGQSSLQQGDILVFPATKEELLKDCFSQIINGNDDAPALGICVAVLRGATVDDKNKITNEGTVTKGRLYFGAIGRQAQPVNPQCVPVGAPITSQGDMVDAFSAIDDMEEAVASLAGKMVRISKLQRVQVARTQGYGTRQRTVPGSQVIYDFTFVKK